MTATLSIVQVTARNVLGLRRMIGFGLLSAFPAFIFFLTSRQSNDIGRIENFTASSLFIFLAVVVPIITVVVAGSVLGSERRGNTLSFLMLRPLSRYSIAGAKLASAIAASFAISAIGAILLGVLASLALNNFAYLFGLLGGTLLANAGYSAIFVPIGYLTERATLTGFIYIFVWESAIAAIITGLSGTSLWRTAASGFASLAPDLDVDIVEAALGTLTAGAGGATLKVAAICAISVVITGYLLQSRDLT
ncbi:MAG: ABC transporter permease subunit [Acidimicrobiia bacterium]|nr:ABC transporter permease subunit [Acidimicrobiia bacterium]